MSDTPIPLGSEPMIDRIRSFRPCRDAVEWLAKRTLAEAWAECERGDWMLWLAGRASIDRKTLVRAAVECARPALRFVPSGEDRPWYALEVALAWCDGRATIEEVRAAATSAAAAAYATSAAAAAAYAAYAAYADAAAAAYAAANADADAAYAAYAAAAAAGAAGAAANAARRESLKASADMVRRLIPVEIMQEALYG